MEELIKRLLDTSCGEYNTCEVDFEDLREAIKYLQRYSEIKQIVDTYTSCFGYIDFSVDSRAEQSFKEIQKIVKEQ